MIFRPSNPLLRLVKHVLPVRVACQHFYLSILVVSLVATEPAAAACSGGGTVAIVVSETKAEEFNSEH